MVLFQSGATPMSSLTRPERPYLLIHEMCEEVLNMHGNNSKSAMLAGLLVGAAAGITGALLLAPTTGKQSRELVRQKTGKIIGATKNRLKRTPAAAGNHSDS